MYTVSVEEYIDNGMLLYTSVTSFIKLESALHDYTVFVSKFSRDIANHNMLGKSFKLGFWQDGKEIYSQVFADIFAEL